MNEAARILVGVCLGLACAALASGAFVFSRLFTVRREGGVRRLMVIGHLVMGGLSLAILPMLRLDALPSTGAVVAPLAWTVTWYLLAQTCLFATLQGMEASRAAPLLGTKVLILALVTVLFMGQQLAALQWLGVVLAAVGIFVLNDAGRRLGGRRIAGVLVACLFYALSDLGVKRLVTVFEMAGNHPVHGGAFAACLMHVVCGVVALVFVAWIRVGDRDDWRAAVPYGVLWLGSVVCLFGAFAMVGVVLGAMLQATRGILSVLLGVMLARLGLAHLEQRVVPHVVLRRTLGAALMVAAIAAYLWPASSTTCKDAMKHTIPYERDTTTTETAPGTIFTLDSDVLEERRRYWVYLPPSCRDGVSTDRRYPVVVHLDGQSHGAWSPTTVEYMIRRKRLPEAIVVGVYNADRECGLGSAERARDLTPTHSLIHHDGTPNDGYRLSGGGDRFRRFLEDELLPRIDARYPTLPHRAIVGQSLSGCFVLDAFLTGVSSFQAFVAMDPCLWWDGDRAKRLTAELEVGSPIFERGLFVAFSGTDDANRAMQQAWFDELVGKAAEPNRRHLRFAHYPEESHISMNLKGFYEGLAFLFGRPCGLDWGER